MPIAIAPQRRSPLPAGRCRRLCRIGCNRSRTRRLSTLEVTVQVSELDIARLSVGQSARVQLDAFPGEGSITGQIEQISPVADPTSRLIPVQVSIPNLSGRLGSGLLARVQFSASAQARVVVPESALAVGEADNTIFVTEGEGDQVKADRSPGKSRRKKPGSRRDYFRARSR